MHSSIINRFIQEISNELFKNKNNTCYSMSSFIIIMNILFTSENNYKKKIKNILDIDTFNELDELYNKLNFIIKNKIIIKKHSKQIKNTCIDVITDNEDFTIIKNKFEKNTFQFLDFKETNTDANINNTNTNNINKIIEQNYNIDDQMLITKKFELFTLEWKYKMHLINPQLFTNFDNTKTYTNMMRLSNNLNYLNMYDCDIFQIPYVNTKYKFTCIYPNNIFDFLDLLKHDNMILPIIHDNSFNKQYCVIDMPIFEIVTESILDKKYKILDKLGLDYIISSDNCKLYINKFYKKNNLINNNIQIINNKKNNIINNLINIKYININKSFIYTISYKNNIILIGQYLYIENDNNI